MILVISPSKTMTFEGKKYPGFSQPVLLDQSRHLVEALKSSILIPSSDEDGWVCSDNYSGRIFQIFAMGVMVVLLGDHIQIA